jgi:hypothetical protein
MFAMSAGLMSARRFVALSCDPEMPPPAPVIVLRPPWIWSLLMMTPSTT